jgi:hypothetical protein
MSRYTLTEAYSEIYNPQKVDELFDNLRFIDYMLDEDIEEVVESLVWEFRDYGSTLDEAFEVLSYSASDEVICESYDQLVQDILAEATITKGSQRSQYAGSAQSRVTSGRGDVLAQQAAAKKLAKKSGKAVASRLSAEADQQAQQRREARRARVDGAISRVKSAMAGAKGGMGRAAKALGGAARQAGSAAAGLAQKGKALLGSLLRKGATAAGKAVYGAGRSIEARGRQASQSGLEARRAGKPSRSGQMTLVLEPTTQEKAGGKASTVGRAVRKVGAALQRMGKGQKQAPEKKEAPQMKALPAARPETETRRAAVQRKLDTAAKGTSSSETRTGSPSPRLALPAKTSGKPAVQRTVSARKQEAAAKLQKAATGTQARGTRFAGPGARLSPTRTRTGYQERLAKFSKQLNKEDYEILVDYIIEDIISAGYALDEMSALDFLEELSENTVIDIALEYLND